MLRIGEPVLRNQLARFDIDPTTLASVVTDADHRSVISGDAGRITIARRRMLDGLRVLAVVGEGKRSMWTVHAALPLPRSVPVRGTPLDSLAALCAGFGVPISVGGLNTTLVVDALLNGSPKRHVRAFHAATLATGRPRADLATVARMARRGTFTNVLLMFALDLAALSDAARTSGVVTTLKPTLERPA